MIKTKIVKQLLESGLLKPYYVVEHSYTDGGGETYKSLLFQPTKYFRVLQQDLILWGLQQMNKKLKHLLKTKKIRGGVMLDTYNQRVIEISATITTRVNDSNEIYVVEDDEQN